MPTTNSSSTSNNKKAYREICVADINTWKWGIKINHCIAKSSNFKHCDRICSHSPSLFLPLHLLLSNYLSLSRFICKKGKRVFLCWCCAVVCARSWPNISYIWLEPPPCDEVNAGRCVSRVARLVSVSVLPPLSHSFSVWAKKSPDKCHAHALWRRPGPARIGLAKSNSRLSTHTQLERTSRTGPQLNKSWLDKNKRI